MLKKTFLTLLISFTGMIYSIAQETFPINGVQDNRSGNCAFINATIVIDYATTADSSIMIIKDGLIADVGKGIKIPEDTKIIDLKGKYIYPSFVDIYTTYGMPDIKKEAKKEYRHGGPQMLSGKTGAYGWNEAIKPEINAAELFRVDTSKTAQYRKLGFGSVLSFHNDGIARGSSVLVTLSDEKENTVMLIDKAAAHYSLRKGISTQDYPSSLMGNIALLRQTYADAVWYENEKNNLEYNLSMEAWTQLQSLPQIMEADDKFQAFRAKKLGEEVGVQYLIKGGGNEYQRINEIKKSKLSFILPLAFPVAYDVVDPYDAENVTLSQMMHWEWAPANLLSFEKASIPFAVTTSGLKELTDFYPNLRKAIKYGLSEKEALKALTYTPANLLQADKLVGSLKKGMVANFLVTSHKIFEEKNIIYQNWIKGKLYEIIDINTPDIRGIYDLNIEELPPIVLKVEGEFLQYKLAIQLTDTSKENVDLKQDGNLLTINFKLKNPKADGNIRLSGWVETENGKIRWRGNGQLPDGQWVKWTAQYKSKSEEEKKNKKIKEEEEIQLGKLLFPFSAYGWKTLPDTETVLIKNATVWTNEEEGNLANIDVLLHKGKIHAIGTDLAPSTIFTKEEVAVRVINAKDKHLTSGIIDEHSHIAIAGGVNEGTQSISSEVRIGDVINSDDINIYRQLAGGVTAAQLLHGSANPIGGQSALIKLRWGLTPEEMKIDGADGFIKFALGENVKQSNWGDNNTTRFPQTRMGVEQTILDGFTRAKEYKNKWEAYNSLPYKQQSSLLIPRTNYELEALVEILNAERFITCHSYVQSEINMLMKLADSLGFKVNTFTHILEGYKVADKMKTHGVGASSFADWWAYKYEVMEAIPYNGAILHRMGIVTAFNSDDAEMARRLNQEAAKAVKYGDVPEEEALKFVTLNPAKLLHLDYRMGSIMVGKDADVVLWSDNPLSVYAKVEQTYIDGVCYYDAEKDKQMRELIKIERARLIQKMIDALKKGEKTEKVSKKEDRNYHCDDMFPQN